MKKLQDFNDRIAVMVTGGIATMWCAYLFALLAIYGATGVDWHNAFSIVSWISQTFLQLVLLSIIMVGQKVLSSASDAQAKEMHDAVMEELSLARKERDELKKLHQDLHGLLQSAVEKAGDKPA